MNPSEITLTLREASVWLTRMAAVDGVVSQNERRLLKKFAEKYGLDPKPLYRMAHAAINDVDIPEVELISASEWKGREFEKFIVSLCSDPTCFTLLSWRSDKRCGDTYPKDSLLPDLHIRHKFDGNKVDHFIECKYRTALTDGTLDISHQIERYREMAVSDLPNRLWIALGVGGHPDSPQELYIIPDECISNEGVINIIDCQECLCNPTCDDFRHHLMKFPLNPHRQSLKESKRF